MHELIEAWRVAEANVAVAQMRAAAALAAAEKAEVPKNLRPAESTDIRVGAVIWYPGDKGKYAEDAYWMLVDEVLHPSSEWKAFCAHDGCRYGLRGAFVETI